MECQAFAARRKQCHGVYGNRGEECLNEELTEKRCLSLKHCPREAKEYYGDTLMGLPSTSLDGNHRGFDEPYHYNKALCASWAESFAYADRELEYGPNIAAHHQEARQVVIKDPTLRQHCRQIAMNLASCLRRQPNLLASSPSSPSPSSWSFTSLKEQWDAFHDAQRMERLATCLKLDQVLKQCQQKQQLAAPKNEITSKPTTEDPLESISPGLRTMKYFGWRGILSKQSVDNMDDGATSTGTNCTDDIGSETQYLTLLRDQVQSSCSREKHAVWACRAVATGCGRELSSLKKCFEEDHEPFHILTASHTNYEGYNATTKNGKRSIPMESIPCYQAQRNLGDCVIHNAGQLLERKQQRESALASSRQ